MRLAQLPGIMRTIVREVQHYNGGTPVVDERPHASAEMERQGTRSGAWQGTMSSGNTPDPLHPGQSVTPHRPIGWDDNLETPAQAVFSTDDPAYDGEPGTLIQVRDWPPNPSDAIGNTSGSRSEQDTSDRDLQTGKAPNRIVRYMPRRIFGIANGMTTGTQGGEGFPWNADKDFLPHVPIARQALGTKGPQKLSDDNAAIPAVYAGNPRP